MAEKTSGTPFGTDWAQMNEQFWNAWGENAKRATAGAETPRVPSWHEGLEMWSRLFAQGESQNAVVERMLASARQFASFAQTATAAGGAAKSPGANPFADAFAQSFGGLSGMTNPMLEALRSISGEGALGFDQLAAETHRFAEPLKHEMTALLSLPTFGFTREHQERAQKLVAANVASQEWLQRYQALMLKASQRAFELMETKLSERSEPGREVGTLRGLYDLWIDAAEDAYAEIALSPDFRHVYGELVNAQMRVRKLVNEEIERNTQTVGMPTRTEVNAVHARLAEVRRRLARIEEALGIDPDAESSEAEPGAAAETERPRARATKAKGGNGTKTRRK